MSGTYAALQVHAGLLHRQHHILFLYQNIFACGAAADTRDAVDGDGDGDGDGDDRTRPASLLAAQAGPAPNDPGVACAG